MHEGYVYVYEPSRTRRSSGSSATYYSVVRANTRRFEEFDDNDVTGTVVRRDGHGRGRGLDEHVRIVAYGDRRVRVRRVGQRIQREHGRELLRRVRELLRRGRELLRRGHVRRELLPLRLVPLGRDDERRERARVGDELEGRQDVACLVMSGSLSGSLSDETINAEGDRDHHHGRGP